MTGDPTSPAVLDDDDSPECGCADKVPADLTPDEEWVCPKCDAVWYGEED